MTIVESTETEQDWKKVERTQTVEQIRCDVCGHEYNTDEWGGNEFSINPDINREAHALGELEELFKAYHDRIPLHVIDDGYDGNEMVFNVPQRPLFDVIAEEVEVARQRQKRSEKEQMSFESEKTNYIKKLGTESFYLMDDCIHHFRYVLNVEASTDSYKHVCDDCYEVLFE